MTPALTTALLLTLYAITAINLIVCMVLCGIVLRRLGRRPFWVLLTIGFGVLLIHPVLNIFVALHMIDDTARVFRGIVTMVSTCCFLGGLIGAILNVRDVTPLSWSIAAMQSATSGEIKTATELLDQITERRAEPRGN